MSNRALNIKKASEITIYHFIPVPRSMFQDLIAIN